MKWFAVLLLGVGELLMSTSGGTGALIGLGVWWFAALVALDLLIGGGRRAQYLWGAGTGAAVWLSMSTELPRAAIAQPGQVIVWAVTAALVLAALLRPAKLPARPRAEPAHEPPAKSAGDPGPKPAGGLASKPPAEPRPPYRPKP